MNEWMRKLLFLPEQASTVAERIDHLHYWVIGITMAGATLVFAAAAFFAYRYRRRAEGELTVRLHAPIAFEATVIVSLLVLFFGFWVVGFRQYVRLQAPPPDAIDVYVTARQWMWKFAYPEGPSTLSVLVVPAGRPVRLVMTSRDVIHSFYVPDFRIKQDVLPGRYTTVWFEVKRPGDHPLYCAEYCGFSHSRMLGRVVAVDAHTWQRFLSGERPDALVAFGDIGEPGAESVRDPGARQPLATMAQRGRDAAARHGCLSCHTLDGQRHTGPSFRGLWRSRVRLSSGNTIIADEAYLTRSMMDPAAQIVAGYAPVMPTYQGLLDPADAAAIIELIKSLSATAAVPADLDYPRPLLQPAETGAGGGR